MSRFLDRSSPCSSAWTGFLVAIALATLASARAEVAYPKLTSIARESADTLTPGSSVRFRFAAVPGSAPIASVSLLLAGFNTGAEPTFRQLTTTQPDLGLLERTVDATWLNTAYQVWRITLLDIWGRSTIYDTNGIRASHSSDYADVVYTGPFTHALDLSTLEFSVSGASDPTGFPTAEIDSVDYPLLRAGQTCRVKYNIKPSGWKFTKIALDLGFTHYGDASLFYATDIASNVGEILLPVTANMQNGVYHLRAATLTDELGRSVRIEGNQYFRMTIEGGTYAWLAEGWAMGGFVVEGNPIGSSSNPVLTTWSRSSEAPLVPGDTIRWRYSIRPGYNPIKSIAARIGGPFGVSQTIIANGADGELALRIPIESPTGTYEVRRIIITDSAGFVRTCIPSSPLYNEAGGRSYPPNATYSRPGDDKDYKFVVLGQIVQPYFSRQPPPITYLYEKQTASLWATGVAGGNVTFQWYEGAVGDTSHPVGPSETPPISRRVGTGVDKACTRWVRGTVGSSVFDSNAATVVVVPRPASMPGVLSNLSIRTRAGSGSETLIVGFSVTGPAPKSVLIRGIGPSLESFGVSGVLPDPILTVYDGKQEVAGQNDSSSMDGIPLTGAFPLKSTLDANVLLTLSPDIYTAKIQGHGQTSGIALAELYSSPTDYPEGSLTNLSARAPVGTGDNVLIAGFAVAGSENVKLLIRAVGETLERFGVSGSLTDPVLTIKRLNETAVLAQNDNWGGSTDLANAFTQGGAFAFPNGSRDSAVVITVSPGAYTATVSGKNGTSGVALVEVYVLR